MPEKIIRQVVLAYQQRKSLEEEEKSRLFDVLGLSIIIDSFGYYEGAKFPDFKEKHKPDALKKIGEGSSL